MALEIPRHLSGSAQLAGAVLDGLLTRAPGRWLVALAAEPGLPRLWAPAFAAAGAPPPAFLYDDWSVFRADRDEATAGAGAPDAPELLFTADLAPPLPAADAALLFLPKGTDAIERALSRVAGRVVPGGRVLVVGAKKSAIVSSRPLAERAVGPFEVSRSGRHAKLLAYHRADEVPAPRDGELRYPVDAWGRPMEVVSLPGVFSHGRLDAGTAELFAEWQPPPVTSALDLGCGSGVLTAALRLAQPGARVDAADVRAEALEATRRTLAANGLGSGDRAGRVVATDVFSDLPGRWQLIVSNPPFHRGPGGHGADFSITGRLIAEAGDHLTPDGRLVMVTNSFIDYLTPLSRAFAEVRVVHQTGRYRITEARRPH